MTLRDALSDFKRHRGNATRFPGERRTTAGRFSGFDARLVHVGPHGSLRDYSYPLSGRYGLDRSRFGVRRDGNADIVWFDAVDSTQRYHEGSALVVTEHGTADWSITQYDLTFGDFHFTHFAVDDADENDAAPAELVAYFGFAPDGRDDRIGQLRHGDVVEVYHTEEHDYLGMSAEPTEIDGLVPADFDALLSEKPNAVPGIADTGRYEESRLSGELVVSLPLDGATTFVSLLADHRELPREDALRRVRELASEYDSPARIRSLATDETSRNPLDATLDAPTTDAITDDLRVLSFLSAETGARIAGPDFDPFYQYSGGYGYTWFRDDAEISRFLLTADDHFDLSLADWHEKSARLYCETQRPDGTWPHRVWPRDGTIAPGWANARVEAGDGADYQADQTGSVITFLATYLRTSDLDAELESEIEGTLRAALDGLDDTLEADGLPIHCQNAWENMTGRFAHTAATYLEAYAELARAPVSNDVRERALEGTKAVLAGLDRLWTGEFYALRLIEDDRDERCDSSALALAAAYRAAASVVDLDSEQVNRLVSHTEAVLDGLWRDPEESEIQGLARFDGDDWRVREQTTPKIWTVSTAWGANAASELADLLSERDDRRADEFARRSRDLLSLLLPGGSLCAETGYLPEQYFDVGEADSATPLGWPHAIRLATVAALDERGNLDRKNERPTTESTRF